MELATCHSSGAWNFEMDPIFLEEFVHPLFKASA
jgi:hypothetical protein